MGAKNPAPFAKSTTFVRRESSWGGSFPGCLDKNDNLFRLRKSPSLGSWGVTMQMSFSLDEHVVFDLETTGLSPWTDEIIEIGAVRIVGDQIDEANIFHQMVKPKRPIPPDATRINGITNEMVAEALPIEEVFPKFLEYVGDRWLIAQNARFDMSFVMKYMAQFNIKKEMEVYDTVIFSRRAFPGEARHNLDIICQRLNLKVEPGQRHRSVGDVKLTAQAFLLMRDRLGSQLPSREKYSA